MKKNLVRLALVGAAATAFALPAAPAHASCAGTFISQCVRELLPETDGSNEEICVIREDTIALYVCV